MDFFHSTSKKNADKILAQGHIDPTQYNFPYFMDKLLDNINAYDSYIDFPNRWLGVPEIPWLGNGVYCFKFLDEAQAYTPNSAIIKIEVCTPLEFDFDSPEDLMMIANYLQNEFKEDLQNKFFDDEVVNAYLMVGTFLLDFIMVGMDDSSKSQCVCLSIILFILVTIRKKPFKPDVVSYKFKLDDVVGKYYTIRKQEIIKGLTGV